MKTGLNSLILSLFTVLFVAGAFAEVKAVEAPEQDTPETRAVTTRDPRTGRSVTKQVPIAPAMTPEEEAAERSRFEAIELPAKDSPEYWVVRSDAITELTPVLTQKRKEMKQKRQMLADYLLKIGKGQDMASKNIEVPDDPMLYAKALGVDNVYAEKDIDVPKGLPTWEETAEFAMRFIIDEGYVPMQFDGQDDIADFIQVAKQKEQYAQKVRKEMRSYVKDALKMWIYLGQIGEQSAAKEWAVQMKLDAEKGKNAERAMIAEERRMANLNRREAEKDRKYQDAQDRASFRSSRRERVYTSRDDRLKYQQTLLNERYTNYYRW
jgi:hypothetical protein